MRASTALRLGRVAALSLLVVPGITIDPGWSAAGSARAAKPAFTPSLAPGPAAPPADLPPGLPTGWYTRIQTSMGTIIARLLPEQAPQTVAYFAAFAEGRMSWVDPLTGETKKGHYYDGLKVHKAIAGERFEAGDPTETGRGSPLIYVVPELKNPKNFDAPGRLGMTRSSLGRISASLFFVTSGSLPYLNNRHPCFGEVVSGQDVVWEICTVKTQPSGKPITPVVLESVRVLPVGNPPPLQEPVPYTPIPLDFGPKVSEP